MARTGLVALLAAAVVLCVAPRAAAVKFYWNGADTLFNNGDNWENGVAPMGSSNVSMTDLRTTQPFTSYVPEGTYSVGSVLKLPRNGKLAFSGESGASTTIRFSTTNTGKQSRADAWKRGGRRDRQRRRAALYAAAV